MCNRMTYYTKCILTILIGMASAAWAEVVPIWSTGVAVPGEKVVLYLIDTEIGDDFFTPDKRPEVQKARVEVLGPHAGANPYDPDQKMVEIYPILVTPDQAGEVRIADIPVSYRKSGKKQSVAIPPLPVVSTAEIKWQEDPITFGTLWYTELKDGYVDQPVRTHVKFFLPGDCNTPVAPQLSAVGIKVGNFQPTIQGVLSTVQSGVLSNPIAFARGANWRTTNFTGSLTPFREGNSDIAGKVLITQQRGFFGLSQAEADLPVISIGALPLPPGAPKNFAHTVGQYSVSATTSAKHLAMNEPIEVEITVRGSGNLEQLECPEPRDAADWKPLPATRKPMLGPNGETIGVVFSRLLRPVAEVSAIPSFEFGYFDPTSQTYRQAASTPIALPWQKSDTAGAGLIVPPTAAEPPPAGEVPVEEMTDIYGVISPAEAGLRTPIPLQLWLLLYLPALGIFLWLLGKAMYRRIAAGAAGRATERELRRIAADTDSLSFLRHIGGFIESHISPDHMSPELQQILERRDAEAFRPDATATISPQEKETMLKRVRKALAAMATTVVALLLALLPQAGAAENAAAAYKAGQYSAAIEAIEKSTESDALKLYNIGCCQYRLGQPGAAAHSWYCALLEAPSFKEARANLAFVQRKEGALLPTGSISDKVFTLLSVPQLRVATIVSTAALALGVALLIALRHRRKPWVHVWTALCALTSLACAADWVYYTTRETPDITSLPPADLACVINKSTLLTSADAKGTAIVVLPPSTPLHLLHTRGSWCYVELFSSGTRGWVNSADIKTCTGPS
ncbi:MAG: BatD family protein [Akkermansia sp.]|nr:BatD family protein [Akkermansia sp.]